MANFASYSHEDEWIVKPLVDWWRLVSEVFLDRDNIAPGEKWEERLETAIRAADKVFVFWCKHAKESKWVRKEYELAIELDKTVVPTLMDEAKLPRALRTYQHKDARQISRHDQGYGAVRAPANIYFVKRVEQAAVNLTTPKALRERLRVDQVAPDQLVAAWNEDLGGDLRGELSDFLWGAATIIL
jgi:TIR domain